MFKLCNLYSLHSLLDSVACMYNVMQATVAYYACSICPCLGTKAPVVS